MQSWKNGAGESREIARSEGEPFTWRLSLAQLKTRNEFSRYPGYTRWIAFLGNDPVTIQHPEKGRERVVPPCEPYRFAGSIETVALAYGPTEDLNLFVKDGAMRASFYAMRFLKGEEIQFPLNGQEHFLFVAKGALELENRNLNQSLSPKARETCRISRTDEKEYLALRSRGIEPVNTIFWATLHYEN